MTRNFLLLLALVATACEPEPENPVNELIAVFKAKQNPCVINELTEAKYSSEVYDKVAPELGVGIPGVGEGSLALELVDQDVVDLHLKGIQNEAIAKAAFVARLGLCMKEMRDLEVETNHWFSKLPDEKQAQFHLDTLELVQDYLEKAASILLPPRGSGAERTRDEALQDLADLVSVAGEEAMAQRIRELQ